jgi:hypothetical protein
MTFTGEERRLLILYYAGSISDTVHIVRLALNDIYDPDERAAALSLIAKLENTDEAAFDGPVPESVVLL